MSIAVTALLKTPLPIIAAVRIISSGFLFLAATIWFGFGIEMAAKQKIVTIVTCLIAASFGLYYSRRLVKSFYISISSDGSITLVELYSPTVHEEKDANGWPEIAQLLPGTTVWPHLIMMRLSMANGHVVFIPVMRALTDQQMFRSLAVACKWILRQNDPAQGAKS